MDKKKTPLQIESDKVQELVKITNNKILELGVYSQSLYDALVSLQALFDRIRNTPEDKQIELNQIKECIHNWKNQVEKIERDYEASGTAVKAGAAGAAMGVGLATLGPTAAMGIATTFGVASTGTAISALSGAAATNAALAWLGGGALAAGGGGMAAGNALIALAGPVGWGIAIAAFGVSGWIWWLAKQKKERLEEIFMLISKRDQKSYRLAILELDERMKKNRKVTGEIYAACTHVYTFGTDYRAMTEEQQYTLGTYLNLMNAAMQLLVNPIIGLQPKFTEEDFQIKSSGNVQIPQIDSDYITLIMLKLQMWSSSKDFEKYKNLIVFLANMFYDVNFQNSDYEILADVFKDDKEFCEKMDIDKKIIDDTLFMIVDYKLTIAKLTKKK
ncbi:hypothetical protein [Mediterranea massiliensis]|uniref:hypothetical protein n=1 Tax=Mediterranea massiliensis TaxID=1841865 RepID=UPI003209E3FE